MHFRSNLKVLSALLFIYLFLSTSEADDHYAQCPCNIYINDGMQTADCSERKLASIPDCVPNVTQSLDFSYNDLRYSVGQFQRFGNLTSLRLFSNYHFVTHNDCFQSLFQLNWLNLGYTKLNLLTGAAFVDQSRLRFLQMGDGFGQLNLTHELFIHLRTLQWINLVGFLDIVISETAFIGLPFLQGLFLRSSRNLRLHKDSFMGLTELRYLSLESCYFSICTQETILKPLLNLEELHLEFRCHILEPDCGNKLLQHVPSIKKLFIDKRFVSNLGKGFLLLTKLEELFLINSGSSKEQCLLDQLNNNVFASLKNTVLKTLSMDTCFINHTDLNSFISLRSLTTLTLAIETYYYNDFLQTFAYGLEYTNIQTICLSVTGHTLDEQSLPKISQLGKTKLKSLQLTNTDYKYISAEFFTGLPKSITSLNLTFNSFMYADVWALGYLENLEMLDLSNQVKSQTCSSSLVLFTENACEKPKVQLKNQILRFEQSLNHTKNLPYRLQRLYVSKSHLLCEFIPAFCTSNNSLKVLDASEQNDLSCFDNNDFWNVLHNLVQLTELNLNSNEISTIPSGSFVGLQKLRTLSLVKNKLIELSFDVSGLVLLDTINLSFNSIQYASDSFMSQINQIFENKNVTIHLTKNPLDCHCNHHDFVTWLLYTKIISNKKHLNCTFENGTKIGLDKISHVHYLLDSKCIMVEVTVGCVVTFSLLNLILGGIAYIWHYRQQLKYLLAFGRRTLNPYHPIEDCEVQMEYDVYISYEGEYYVTPDVTLRDFVIKIVLPGLERLGVRALIREELQAGRNLYEVISTAVRRSKKVLALLSKDYCKDMWNVFEFNQAVMEGIYTNRQVAIPVLFESLRRDDVNEEIYAFLQMEPLYKYTSELSNKAFIEFLHERISDTRTFS